MRQCEHGYLIQKKTSCLKNQRVFVDRNVPHRVDLTIGLHVIMQKCNLGEGGVDAL